MLPFVLYFITGIVTGFHLYSLLSLAVYGAPLNPLELVGLLGSLGFLIAAFLSLFRPYIAARVALISALAVWCFYAPAIAQVLRGRMAAAILHLVVT